MFSSKQGTFWVNTSIYAQPNLTVDQGQQTGSQSKEVLSEICFKKACRICLKTEIKNSAHAGEEEKRLIT